MRDEDAADELDPVPVAPDIDELFDYSLARHLDGFADLLGEPPSVSSRFTDRDT